MDVPSGAQPSIRILKQKDGVRIEGERSLHYEGSKRVIFQRRQKGKFMVFIPVVAFYPVHV